MEPLTIKSKTNTKLKSVLWGIFFILLGLAFDTGMIILFITEDLSAFSFVYVLGVLLSFLFFFAGFYSINMRKYPLELLADDKGIHYFVFDSKFGYGKHEILIPWETVTAITQYAYDERDPEDCEYAAIAIQTLGEDDPAVIWLGDAELASDDSEDVVSALNEMRRFYGGLGKKI